MDEKIKPENPVNPYKASAPPKNKPVPKGVRACSIIFYIYFALDAVIVLSTIAIFTGIINLSDKTLKDILGATEPAIANVLTAIIVIVILFFIAITVINFAIARNLPKARNWARIAAITLAVLGFFGGFQLSVASVISLIPNGFILYYLIFNKEAKEFFS